MVSSKLKQDSKKINMNIENITIDAKHTEMINKFNKDKKLVPKLKSELNSLIEDYKNSKDNSLKNNPEYIIERNMKKDNIYKLKNRINKILNNDELKNYYLEVGNLLHDYYNNVENIKNEDTDIEKFEENLINYQEDKVKKNKKPQNSVIDFFNNREINNDVENENDNGENNYTSMKISDFIKEESTFKKKNFLKYELYIFFIFVKFT